MKNLKTILIIGGIVITSLLGVIAFKEEPKSFGSVAMFNEYRHTQLTGAVATTSEILDGAGALGSVIITEDQAGAVVLYDATSTTAYSKTNGTRIADFQNAMAEGVYTFDIYVKNGIIFESADGFSFAGDWTITYRDYN